MDNSFSNLCEGLAKTCRSKGVCRFESCPIQFEMSRRYGSVLPFCDMANADVWAVVIGRMFFGKTYLITAHPCTTRCSGGVSDVVERIRLANETHVRLEDAERKAEIGNCRIRS